MIDTLRLTAEERDAPARAARGLARRSSTRAYLDAIGERDGELHCYLRTCEEPSGDGIPIALKDVISTKGIETTAGSKILERLHARLRRDRRRAGEGGRALAAREDEHGRVRDGLVDGELGVGAVA